MEQSNKVWYVTLLLTTIAGYCDTVTFVAADAIFSAHVTGNFIVFAYQIVKGSDFQAWIKLLTFPVFIFSVIVGGIIASKSVSKYKILLWEGVLLIISGTLSYAFGYLNWTDKWTVYSVALLVVFAMGLQNAFGKLFSKETYGPTTMMTGNVTQAALDLGNFIKSKFVDSDFRTSLTRQMITIFGFLAGCFLGAIAGKYFGLGTVIVPGFAMIACYFKNRQNA